MRKFNLILAITLCFSLAAPLAASAETVLGQPITLKEVTKVSEIMADPDAYVGKKVLVEGLVVAVCERRGCWMDIASDAEFEKIQIKVDDGVIVFPMEAKGKTALVEGLVEVLELSQEEAIALEKHKSEEHGTPFDPGKITGPQKAYRIRGTGAVIK